MSASGGPTRFRVGTIVVNASGSLLLGILTGLSLYHGLGTHLLAVVGTGLCGGYTTWSTASWETCTSSAPAIAPRPSLYTVGGLGVCLGAAAAGIGLTALGVTAAPAPLSRNPGRQSAKASGGGHEQKRLRSP